MRQLPVFCFQSDEPLTLTEVLSSFMGSNFVSRCDLVRVQVPILYLDADLRGVQKDKLQEVIAS